MVWAVEHLKLFLRTLEKTQNILHLLTLRPRHYGNITVSLCDRCCMARDEEMFWSWQIGRGKERDRCQGTQIKLNQPPLHPWKRLGTAAIWLVNNLGETTPAPNPHQHFKPGPSIFRSGQFTIEKEAVEAGWLMWHLSRRDIQWMQSQSSWDLV